MLVLALLSDPALAGYGDAGAGYPTVRGRQMTLWVNAVRAEPGAFQADYQAGGCSFAQFSASEQSPKQPYRWHDGLARVALEHSVDMETNNWFSHDSSDGTTFADRVGPAYPGWTALGENIAFGYPSARATVTQGWMCSNAGHRAALMSGTYVELGGDMAGSYATADMGNRNGPPARSLRMGAHEPEVPRNTATFLADWKNASPPTAFEVVFDGDAEPLALDYGTTTQGVWSVDLPVDRSACHLYWFRAVVGGTEERFPETGSYSFGTCAAAGADTGFVAEQVGPVVHTQSTASWPLGGQVTLTVTGGVPGETVAVVAGGATGAGPCPAAIGGRCVDVTNGTRVLGTAVANASGSATLVINVPAGVAPSGTPVVTQAVAADGLGNWGAGPTLAATLR